ncbi:MAG: hypothetical protein M3540_09885 [Actinomycetota bacterium]|nr:hypothetical protein [Actinomycetota bacterium]
MSVLEQPVVLLPARATTFTVLCAICIDEHPDEFYRATVTGSLRLDAAHGAAFCPRGHEVRVERSGRPATQPP